MFFHALQKCQQVRGCASTLPRICLQGSGSRVYWCLAFLFTVLPTSEALTHPRSAYQLDFQDYGAELVAHLSDAWALARDNIKATQTKQKRQ